MFFILTVAVKPNKNIYDYDACALVHHLISSFYSVLPRKYLDTKHSI